MQSGKAQQIDTPLNRSVAGFFGSPPVTFLNAAPTVDDTGLEGNGFRPKADGIPAIALKSCGGSEEVGLRLEQLRIASPSENDQAGALCGRINLIESLGSQTMVRVQVGEKPVIAQFEWRPVLGVGDEVPCIGWTETSMPSIEGAVGPCLRIPDSAKGGLGDEEAYQ
ncbi:hypothetical protein GCM10007874_52380 [Labrys miyagiensis]|uniref:Transport-associated OB type 2 domain-containing protein n=1 Tax=Labrys miyagiensis TaxID=346912 RepID=A0ABQ6CVD2_9HYPH|nr:TOBE domain-containing protein [Labrys miyagiensis]GLS22221.1 hypothetical protein GCM10007874_52380 [Labrys miyagiensis]